jgi:hypothetical protein
MNPQPQHAASEPTSLQWAVMAMPRAAVLLALAALAVYWQLPVFVGP